MTSQRWLKFFIVMLSVVTMTGTGTASARYQTAEGTPVAADTLPAPFPITVRNNLEVAWFALARTEIGLELRGEMTNLGDETIELPSLTFSFVDSTGTELGSGTAWPIAPVAGPHDRVPFTQAPGEFAPGLGRDPWTTVSVQVGTFSWDGTDTDMSQLEVISDPESHVPGENFDVTVVNTGSEPYIGPLYEMDAWYDQHHRFIGACSTGIDILAGASIIPNAPTGDLFRFAGEFPPFDHHSICPQVDRWIAAGDDIRPSWYRIFVSSVPIEPNVIASPTP